MPFPRFESARILVVGDAMLDRYWHGEAGKLSAEAPVPVVRIEVTEDRPGGAANVAINVASLGAAASLVAALGEDEPGAILETKLASAGIASELLRPRGMRTTTKLRIVSRHQQMVRADFEDLDPVDGNLVAAAVGRMLDAADVLVLSDYDKGVLHTPRAVIELAERRGKPVLVDPKHKPFEAYRGATILKPNRSELERAVGPWVSESDMVARCRKLIDDLGLLAMLVTGSAEGMTLVRAEEETVHYPARTREVYDVSGAGDTVIATLASALASGETLLDAVGISNIAAGIVVSHFGITSVSGPELKLELSGHARYNQGIMSRERLSRAVQEAKRQGKRIVFTNGCFDILHAGHVDYLCEAKKEGDVLIVAVNSDDSVARLKGDGRPVNPLDRRMTMLAGLEAVDWVVPFDEDTPEALLEELKPDVLVKGGDYSIDQVVGADIVLAADGEVKVLGLIEDCSTSAIVEKIRKL